jgi:hypothetical protein
VTSSISRMREAVATPCPDYDSCWRPVEVPDGFPFVSGSLAAVWWILFLVCIGVFIARLGRD